MTAHRRLRMYPARTNGLGYLVDDVLGLPLSWLVVRDDHSRLDFKAIPTLTVCTSDTSKHLEHGIRQVRPLRGLVGLRGHQHGDRPGG